jgi:hypothetical protein
MNINAIESQSRRRKTLSEISPEILLSIFSNFDSNEVVVFRRVCKHFLDVIDNNKTLWRIFELIQQEGDDAYPSQAIDLFDEKSGSTLEEVLIQESDINFKSMLRVDTTKHLLTVLDRSKANLKSISIKIYECDKLLDQVLQLSKSLPRLRELVLRQRRMVIRFTSRFQNSDPSTRGHLRILSLPYLEGVEFGSLLLDSLVSFGHEDMTSIIKLHSIISQFAETVVHLDLGTHDPTSSDPLLCPRLKVVQASLRGSVTSYFDCPNLQVLVLKWVRSKEVTGLPPSIEELWLVGKMYFSSNDWEFLQNSCPRLKILKLGQYFIRPDDDSHNLDISAIVRGLIGRQQMVNNGEEIDGLKMNQLHKLVIPIKLFNPAQFDRLKEVAVEVIDLSDYPDFIEVEY